MYAPVATMKYRQHEKNVVGNISFLQYVKKRLLGLKEQKNALHLTILQAQEFERIFSKELTKEKQQILHAFATLEEKNWFRRRRIIYQNKLLKSGTIRNIGLFFIV